MPTGDATDARREGKIDARGAAIEFRIQHLDGGSYLATMAEADGFVRSPVWGRAFRLRRVTDRLGQPDFRLDVR